MSAAGCGCGVEARLEEARRLCARLGLRPEWDPERDPWLYALARHFVPALGIMGHKEWLLEMVSPRRPELCPDKVKRKRPRQIAEWLMERWSKYRHRILEGLVEFAPGIRLSDPAEAAVQLASQNRFGPLEIWLLGKAAGREDLCAEAPEGEAEFLELYGPPEHLAAHAEYEILRKALADFVADPEARARLRESGEAWRRLEGEVLRLRSKLEEAGRAVAAWKAEAEGLRREAEEARGAAGAVAAEYARILAEKDALLAEKDALIAELREENARLRAALGPAGRPLEGRRVCVVGDPGRLEGYRALAERLGAEVAFVDGISGCNRVPEAVRSSDAVLVVAAYAKHKASEPAKALAEAAGKPFAYVPAAGLRAFREALDALAGRFAAGRAG